jgi:hypothetical protein
MGSDYGGGQSPSSLLNLYMNKLGLVQNATNQATLDAIRGQGGQLAVEGSQLNDIVNPAYRNAINQLGSNLTSMLNASNQGLNQANAGVNAINLNGLSPGEAAAIERSNNQGLSQTGNLGLVNPTNTIANAMNFGGAFNNKVGIYGNMLNSASNARNASSGAFGQGTNFGNVAGVNAGFNPFAVASGNTSTFGSNLLGNLTSGNNAALAAGSGPAMQTSVPGYANSIGQNI